MRIRPRSPYEGLFSPRKAAPARYLSSAICAARQPWRGQPAARLELPGRYTQSRKDQQSTCEGGPHVGTGPSGVHVPARAVDPIPPGSWQRSRLLGCNFLMAPAADDADAPGCYHAGGPVANTNCYPFALVA